MKTIEQEAKENCEYNQDSLRQYDKHFIEAFKDGVEFAQRWIPIEDELPNADGEANGISKVVIAKSEDLADEVSAYYDSVTKDWKIYPSGQKIEVTEWRPINRY